MVGGTEKDRTNRIGEASLVAFLQQCDSPAEWRKKDGRRRGDGVIRFGRGDGTWERIIMNIISAGPADNFPGKPSPDNSPDKMRR